MVASKVFLHERRQAAICCALLVALAAFAGALVFRLGVGFQRADAVDFPAGSITGTISWNGSPVTGLAANPFYGMCVSFDSGTSRAYVDAATGGYSFIDVGVGSQALRVQNYCYGADVSGDLSAEVLGGQTTTKDIDLTDTAGVVVGNITVNGQPFPAHLYEETAGCCTYSNSYASADEDGHFVWLLPPGTYTASVSSHAYHTDVLGAFAFTVTAGETVDVGTVDFAAGSIAGTVSWNGSAVTGLAANPFYGMCVSFDSGTSRAYVDAATGGYSFIDVGVGSQALRVQNYCYGADVSGDLSAEVLGGQTTTKDIDLTDTAGVVVGNITVNGQPFPAHLYEETAGCCTYSNSYASADADGHFVWLLPPGTYTASVSTHAYNTDVLGTFDFTVTAGETTDVGEVVLTPPAPTPTATPTPAKLLLVPPFDSADWSEGSYCAEGWSATGDATTSGHAVHEVAYDFDPTCALAFGLASTTFDKTTSIAAWSGDYIEARLSYRVNAATGSITTGSATSEFSISLDLTDQSSPDFPYVNFGGGSRPKITSSCTATVGSPCVASGDLAQGEHTITFSGQAQCNGAAQPCLLPNLRALVHLLVSRDGAGDASGSASFDVDIISLNIRARQDTGSISGRVTDDSSGEPLDGCAVYAIASGYLVGSAQTDVSGMYRVERLGPGNYQVFFRCEGTAGYWSEWYDDREAGAGDIVTVLPATNTAGIDAALSPTCTAGCPNPTLRVGSVAMDVGEKASLSLEALNILPPGLGAWTMNVTYDPTVVACTSPVDWLPPEGFCDPELGGSTLRVVGISSWGLEGDTVLRSMTFRCLGAGSSPIEIDVEVLADATIGNPQNISADVQPGKITCTPDTGIAGRITDKIGSPIEGAEVFTERIDSCCASGSATTDAEGLYRIEDLPPGQYTVSASSKGYVTEYFENVREFDAAAIVVVNDNQTTSDINFALNEGARISGRVTDEEGDPIESAFVYASAFGGCCSSAFAYTDPDGAYVLQGLATDNYRVQASHADFRLEYYDDIGDYASAQAVQATEGEKTPGIDFALRRTGRIQGQVTDKLGNSIVGALVYAYPVDGCCTVTTGTFYDGSFFLLGLLEGRYRIRVQATGFLEEYYDNVRDFDEADEIAVGEGEIVTSIDFELNRPGSITGRVTDKAGDPISDAYVSASGPSYEGATTDANGNYTINDLVGGEYIVDASASGFLSEYYDGVRDSWDGTRVGVANERVTAGIDFVLNHPGSISGRVTDKAGNPIVGASVSARGGDLSSWNNASSGADGTYTIVGLPPGAYTVAASAAGVAVEYYNDARDPVLATPIGIGDGGAATGIDFVLNGLGRIAGRVTDKAGNPLADVAISAQRTNACCGYGYATTAADGAYIIPQLPTGQYRVTASLLGFVTEYFDNVQNWQAFTPVSVNEGSDAGPIAIALNKLGLVSGRVLDKAGTPIATATVSLRSSCTGNILSITQVDSVGFYTFPNLLTGSYVIRAGASGFFNEYYSDAGGSADCAGADVLALQLDASITADFALNQPEGVAAHLWMDIVGSSQVRAGVPVTYTILYGNRGTEDIPAPLLTLNATNGAKVKLVDGVGFQDPPLRLFAAGSPDSAGTLKPGSSFSIPVQVVASQPFSLEIGFVDTSGVPFDWEFLASAGIPAGADPTDWSTRVQRAHAEVGDGWDDVMAALQAIANIPDSTPGAFWDFDAFLRNSVGLFGSVGEEFAINAASEQVSDERTLAPSGQGEVASVFDWFRQAANVLTIVGLGVRTWSDAWVFPVLPQVLNPTQSFVITHGW